MDRQDPERPGLNGTGRRLAAFQGLEKRQGVGASKLKKLRQKPS